MLSLYRHFLTAQLAATSLVRNAPLVDFYLCTNARGRAPTTRAAGLGVHTRKAAVPRAFAVIALDGHQGDFQDHRRRQMNFLVAFGEVAPANFGRCML